MKQKKSSRKNQQVWCSSGYSLNHAANVVNTRVIQGKIIVNTAFNHFYQLDKLKLMLEKNNNAICLLSESEEL